MKKMHSTEPTPAKAYLVGIRDNSVSKAEAEALRSELAGLADTLGLDVVGGETVNVREKSPQYGLGSGKAAEIVQKARDLGAECVIFDREITPTQQRNWEKLSAGASVSETHGPDDPAVLAAVDRQELIIRIFAMRAQTKEAVLQAELARLLYALPRLSHKYIDLSRQRGGRYGTRGAGETRLETDRRVIEEKIAALKREIAEVRRHRETQRKQRKKAGVPVAALVGYTNAGKSSLHRALSGSEAYVEDKLFATLDTTARRLRLPSGDTAVLVDTVGFIRRLPHNLVDAFRSTLEEAAQADLLIHVVDASDPAAREQYATVREVREELGAGKIKRITALNKADIEREGAGEIKLLTQDCISVSARTGENLDGLLLLIQKSLKF
jgi:GTP-binding protein HflX